MKSAQTIEGLTGRGLYQIAPGFNDDPTTKTNLTVGEGLGKRRPPPFFFVRTLKKVPGTSFCCFFFIKGKKKKKRFGMGCTAVASRECRVRAEHVGSKEKRESSIFFFS